MADLLFVEHESQLPLSVPEGARVIALSAEAMNALDKHKIPFSTADQYLSSDDWNAAGIKAYEPTRTYCAQLDDWLESEWPAVRRAGIRPATLSNYDFKILADTLALRAAELRAIIEAERPIRIYAFPTRADRLDSTLAFRGESAYARVLPIVAAETGTPVQWESRSTVPIPPSKHRRWLPRVVPSRWRHQLAHLRKSGLGALLQSRSPSEGDAVLLLNITPDIRHFVQEEAASWRFVHWPGEGRPITLPSGAAVDFRKLPVSRTDVPRTLFGADPPLGGLVPPALELLVRERIVHFMRSIVPMMVDAVADADIVVDRYQPRVALAGIIASPRARAAAAHARRLGVPLAIWQHGGTYGYLRHAVHYYNDLLHADLFLTYGEGTSTYLRKEYEHLSPRAEICAVGSPDLTSLSRKGRGPGSSGDRPLVLYAATCLMGHRVFAAHYRDCEYFRLLTDAANALGRANDIDPVIKVHPGDNSYNPIGDWCERHAPRVRIDNDGAFINWLDRADLVIIDLPGTPLVQGLARDVPMLSYCNQSAFPISEAARPLLQRAVRLETDREVFVAAIARGAALVRELSDAPRSTEFFDNFGTRPDPSQRASRALTAAVPARAGALAS